TKSGRITLGILALAVGLTLMASRPAAAVTRTTAGPTYCLPPTTAVTWPRPAGTGYVASDGRGVIGTKGFWVNAIPYDPNCPYRAYWRNNQQIQIDWMFYWWNASQQRWVDFYLGSNGGPSGAPWVNAYGPNYSIKVPQLYRYVSRNFTYLFRVRV